MRSDIRKGDRWRLKGTEHVAVVLDTTDAPDLFLSRSRSICTVIYRYVTVESGPHERYWTEWLDMYELEPQAPTLF
jgi:hypothetical protein